MTPALSPELILLAWTLLLALFQILLTAGLRTRETGLDYNASPRDFPALAPVGTVTGRALRAQKNLFETLPVFIAAVLIVHSAHLEGALTWWGAVLYFWARVIYLPAYLMGIKYFRSIVWLVGILGIAMLLVAILCPGAAAT